MIQNVNIVRYGNRTKISIQYSPTMIYQVLDIVTDLSLIYHVITGASFFMKRILYFLQFLGRGHFNVCPPRPNSEGDASPTPPPGIYAYACPSLVHKGV